MMEGTDELIRRARDVRRHAHAPYSGFRVGAALMASDGSIHVGCNVENASYGLTLCAERNALGAAVSGGHRQFRALALSAESGSPAPPCGACRQALAEFSRVLPVISESPGGVAKWTLEALLPEPFVDVSTAPHGKKGGGPSGGPAIS